MAILDLNMLLAEDQAVTATAISENVVAWNDTGTIPYDAAPMTRNIGSGTPVPVLCQVTEAFATLTSLTFTIETSNSADLSSATVLASSGAIPVASLVPGFKVPSFRFVPDATMLKYVGLRFTVGGSDATAGKITANIGTWADS